MLYVVSLVQCRTALIAFVLATIFSLMVQKKIKVWHLFVGLVSLIFLLNNKTVLNFIDHVFFISKYAGQGASAFTSGRLDYWAEAILSIMSHPFIGVGKYYVDCLYLQLLAEGGILEFFIVIPVVVSRLFFSIKNRKKNSLANVLFILTLYYIITSFLEAQTPFGPGTSACMFWLIAAFTDAFNEFDKKEVSMA